MVDVFRGATGGAGPGSGSPTSADPPSGIWFDGSDVTWGSVIGNSSSLTWDAGAAVTVDQVRIRWAFGGLYPGVGAAGAFALECAPSTGGPWTEILADASPETTAGVSYPGDFEITYDLADPGGDRYWRLRSTTSNNNDIFTIEAEAAPPPGPAPDDDDDDHVDPEPARALLEIYTADPDGDRWDVALWDAGAWAGSGWQDVTPQGVTADVTWGATNAESGILAEVRAGRWQVITHDPDRLLDPANASSPYATELVPGLPIRISHRSRVIRTGVVETLSYSHAEDQGVIAATDKVSIAARANVPEDTDLPDTLWARARAACSAAAVDLVVLPTPPSGDPDLAPWEPGEFSVWQIVAAAAAEALHVPYLDNHGRLGFRPWASPLLRGAVIGAGALVDLVPYIADDDVVSVVIVNDELAGEIERAVTPTPRYGRRVHRRDLATHDGEAYAAAVLGDRSAASLRWRPGDIFPSSAELLELLAQVEINEIVALSHLFATPAVEARTRVLGIRVWVRDLGDRAGPDWRYWLYGSTAAAEPLIADPGGLGAPIIIDDDTGEPLYPDGVS